MLRLMIFIFSGLFCLSANSSPLSKTARPDLKSDLHSIPGARPAPHYEMPLTRKYEAPSERPPESKSSEDFGRIYDEDQTKKNQSALDKNGLDALPPVEKEVGKKENDEAHGSDGCNDKVERAISPRCKDR